MLRDKSEEEGKGRGIVSDVRGWGWKRRRRRLKNESQGRQLPLKLNHTRVVFFLLEFEAAERIIRVL